MEHFIKVPLIAKVRYNNEWFTVLPSRKFETCIGDIGLVDFPDMISPSQAKRDTWEQVINHDADKYKFYNPLNLPSMASKNNRFLKFKDVGGFIHYVPMEQIQGIQTVDEV